MEEKTDGKRRVIRRKSAEEKNEQKSSENSGLKTRKRISRSSSKDENSSDQKKSVYGTNFNSDTRSPRKRDDNEKDDSVTRSAKRRIGLKKKSDSGYVPKKRTGADGATEGKRIIRKKSEEGREKRRSTVGNEEGRKKVERGTSSYERKRDEDKSNSPGKRFGIKKADGGSEFGRKKTEGRGGRRDDKSGTPKRFSKSSDHNENSGEKRFSKKYSGDSDNEFKSKSPYSKKKQLEYNNANPNLSGTTRLNKFIANAGICSRREADEYIKAGVVKINDKIITELGTKVMPDDIVKFNDSTIKSEKKVYLLLNKPKDYITTTDDPHAKNTVMDLIEGACKERIYPVGRLDRNTTGLLLFTNDGEMAKKLTHPKHNKKKIYHVYLDKNFDASDFEKLIEGFETPEGFIQADEVSFVEESDRKQVGVELHTGQNHAVKHLFEALGYHVEKLDRVYFAGLTKKNLPRGEWRFLTDKEIGMLRMGAYA